MFLFKVNSLSFWKSKYEEVWDSEKVFFCFKGELIKKLLEILAPKVFCSFKLFSVFFLFFLLDSLSYFSILFLNLFDKGEPLYCLL